MEVRKTNKFVTRTAINKDKPNVLCKANVTKNGLTKASTGGFKAAFLCSLSVGESKIIDRDKIESKLEEFAFWIRKWRKAASYVRRLKNVDIVITPLELSDRIRFTRIS